MRSHWFGWKCNGCVCCWRWIWFPTSHWLRPLLPSPLPPWAFPRVPQRHQHHSRHSLRLPVSSSPAACTPWGLFANATLTNATWLWTKVSSPLHPHLVKSTGVCFYNHRSLIAITRRDYSFFPRLWYHNKLSSKSHTVIVLKCWC